MDDKAFAINHVTIGTPAHIAGIKAGQDFVLGAEQVSVRSEADLEAILRQPTATPLPGGVLGPQLLYVYNAPTATVRAVALVPVGKQYPNPSVVQAQMAAVTAVAKANEHPPASAAVLKGATGIASLDDAAIGELDAATPAATGATEDEGAATDASAPKAAAAGGRKWWRAGGGSAPNSAPASAANSDTEGDGGAAKARGRSAAAAAGSAKPPIAPSITVQTGLTPIATAGATTVTVGTGGGNSNPSSAPGTPTAAAAAAGPVKRAYAKPEDYVPVKLPPRVPPRAGSVLHRQIADSDAAGISASAPVSDAETDNDGAGSRKGGSVRSSSLPPTPKSATAGADGTAVSAFRLTPGRATAASGGGSGGGNAATGMLESLLTGGVSVAYATAVGATSLARGVTSGLTSVSDNVRKDLTALSAEFTATTAIMKEALYAPEGRWWPSYGFRTKAVPRFPLPTAEDAQDEGAWLTDPAGLACGLRDELATSRLARLGYGSLFTALTDWKAVRRLQAAEAAAALARGEKHLDPVVPGAESPETALASIQEAAAAAAAARAALHRRPKPPRAARKFTSEKKEKKDKKEKRPKRRAAKHPPADGDSDSSVSDGGKAKERKDKKGKDEDGSDSSSGSESDSEGDSDSSSSSGSDADVSRGPSPASGAAAKPRTRAAKVKESEELARRRAAQMGILSLHSDQIAYDDIAASRALTDPAALATSLSRLSFSEQQAGGAASAAEASGGEGGAGEDAPSGLLDKIMLARKKTRVAGAPLKSGGEQAGAGGGAPNSFAGLGASQSVYLAYEPTAGGASSGATGGGAAGKAAASAGASGATSAAEAPAEVQILYSNPMSL